MAVLQPPLPDPWYGSGTFWAIAAVLVAVIAIPVAYRAARPRRVLYIAVDSVVSLLRTAPGIRGRTEVRHDGRVLTEPKVVIVDVVSRSALDIAAVAFGDAPLELEFGVPVVALLEQLSDARRPAVREPTVKVVGTALHVGPALLTRRHQLRYTVLLDGEPRFRPVVDLVDVTVREQPAPRSLAKREVLFRAALLFWMGLLVVLAILNSKGVVDGFRGFFFE